MRGFLSSACVGSNRIGIFGAPVILTVLLVVWHDNKEINGVCFVQKHAKGVWLNMELPYLC